ncbi:WXG100 family type VII secretion target [Nocardioides sp. P5_E3]
MDQVQVMHAAFAKAKDDVYDAAERLRTGRNQIDGRVRGFLNAGWSGEAADAFSDAWEEWKESAGEVLAGLTAMRELLDETQSDFITSDDASQQRLDALSARIIDRLG